MPYKVIAHRRPEALGGRQHPFQTAPALVANDQGQLSVVHDGQRQFMPMSPEGQREALGQVLGEKHNWHRYPHGSQPDWLPGSVVKSDVSGGSYLEPNEPVLTPTAEDDGGAGGMEDGGEDDGAVGDTNVLPGMAGPPNTAPRQLGKMQVMRGKAKNDGEPFDYELPLTTCVTCVNLQPVLLQIQPCRMPSANINLADFGYYNMVGGCPYYQFGMSIPPGGDDSDAPAASPATSADVSDTIQPGTFQMSAVQMSAVQMDEVDEQLAAGADADTNDMVRGALIQLLGGAVTGTVSKKVELVGPPETTDAAGANDTDDADAEDDDADAEDDDAASNADVDDSFHPDAFPAAQTGNDAGGDVASGRGRVQMGSFDGDLGAINRVADRLRGEPHFERMARSMAGLDGKSDDDPANIRAISPNGPENLVRDAAEHISHQWDDGGGIVGNPLAYAMAKAVHAVHGHGRATLGHVPAYIKTDSDTRYGPHRLGLQAWAKAQYAETQDHLRKTGQSHVTGYRRMVIGAPHVLSPYETDGRSQLPGAMRTALDSGKEYRNADQKINMAPLSSFSSDPHLWEGANDYTQRGDHHVAMAMHIPAKDVFATHETGLGTHRESEVVALGGTHRAYVHSTPAPQKPDFSGFGA